MVKRKIPKVLSIQSHVVHGYVGNRSVTFPMQLNGMDVDVINTVQKCTHSQYPHFTGPVLSTDDFTDIVNGLRKNQLLGRYDYIMTGYTPTASLLTKVTDLVKEIKTINPKAVYLCDPVMGDYINIPGITHPPNYRGQFYVAKETAEVYKTTFPIADILTPNQFELETLVNSQLNTDSDFTSALRTHFQSKTCIVTSNSGMTDLMTGYLKDRHDRVFKFTQPRKPVSLTGTGDCFAACFMINYSRELETVQILKNVLHMMQNLVNSTMEYADEEDKKEDARELYMDSLELQIIGNQDLLRVDGLKIDESQMGISIQELE